MKAIILCAGQGRRLLPYTESTPKCMLSLGDKHFIEWQIDTLLSVGVEQIIAVIGYAAPRVTSLLNERYGTKVRTVYNPFYELADNLASCWIARDHLCDEFILINGDTLFEPAIVTQLLRDHDQAITLVTDCKNEYDDDDMKVIADQSRLLAIGKKLPLDQVTEESIGMIHFNPAGAAMFKDKIETLMYSQEALQQWYLTVIDDLAQQNNVSVCSIHGKDWAELDFVQDLEQAQALVTKWQQPMSVRM